MNKIKIVKIVSVKLSEVMTLIKITFIFESLLEKKMS